MTLALANYTDLQATALAFMERTGDTNSTDAAPVWIQVAEARLNREIGAVETEGTLTGTIDSRTIDISSLSMVQPIALFVAQTGYDERPVQLQANSSFRQLTTSGYPAQACVDGTTLQFDRPLDVAYPFRILYRQRFALSGSATTNWLLTNHPDVYLAATLMWGAGYNEAWENGSVWKSVLDEAIPSIKGQIAANKRGVLRVDDALLANGGASYAELVNGDF